MISWSLVYVISEWIIRLVMLPVVTRRRSPAAAMAWLLVIFFIPWIGLACYLVLGGDRLGKRRIKRHARVLRAMARVDRMAVQQPHIVQPEIDVAQQHFVHLAENLGSMPILGGNQLDLIGPTPDVMARIVEDIDAATHHVHMLYYIFTDDPTTRPVIDALQRAAARGVTCRVLADAVGSSSMLRHLAPQLRKQGIAVHPMLPVNPLRRKFARVDLRNHRKLTIIDGRIAYTGSHNMTRADYTGTDVEWEDLTVRVAGPTVLQLQLVFIEDWHFTTDEPLDADPLLPAIAEQGDFAVQVLPTGPNHPTQPLLHLVVEAIHAARRRICITTPYLVPDEASLLALCLAAKRSVKVELVVPERSDHRLVRAAARAYYEELLEAGVHIHQHTPSMLHAKTLTIDDTVSIVGSANFDIRSFYLNFELNLLMYGPHANADLREYQRHYIRESQPVDLAQWRNRPWLAQVNDDIIKLLSPLL